MGKQNKRINPKREIVKYLNHLKPKQFENEHIFGMCEGIRIALHITTGEAMESFKLTEFPEEWGWQIRARIAEGVPKKELVALSPNAPIDEMADRARRGN